MKKKRNKISRIINTLIGISIYNKMLSRLLKWWSFYFCFIYNVDEGPINILRFTITKSTRVLFSFKFMYTEVLILCSWSFVLEIITGLHQLDIACRMRRYLIQLHEILYLWLNMSWTITFFRNYNLSLYFIYGFIKGW